MTGQEKSDLLIKVTA